MHSGFTFVLSVCGGNKGTETVAHFQIVLGQNLQSLMYDKLVSYLKLASTRNGILFLTIVTYSEMAKNVGQIAAHVGNRLHNTLFVFGTEPTHLGRVPLPLSHFVRTKFIHLRAKAM